MTIGRKNKTIWAITISSIMFLGTFAIAMPYQQANADHDRIRTLIEFYRGETRAELYIFDVDASCGEDCDVMANMNNRDHNRFNRWCPSNPMVLTIDADGEDTASCLGKGPWEVRFTVNTINAQNQNVANSHGVNISVNIMGQ